MPGSTGPDLNTYTIPEVQLGDTFNVWRDASNTAAYKLNKLKVYDVNTDSNAASIGATYTTAGVWTAFVQPTVTSGHTFTNLIRFTSGISASGGFTLGGNAWIVGGVSLSDALTVGYTTTLNSSVVLGKSSADTITVNAVFGNGLTANGAIRANAGLTATTLDVGGAARFAGGLSASALYASTGSTFAAAVSVVGGLSASALYASAGSTFAAAVSFVGGLSASALYASAGSTFAAAVSFVGGLSASRLYASTGSTFASNLSVLGAATVNTMVLGSASTGGIVMNVKGKTKYTPGNTFATDALYTNRFTEYRDLLHIQLANTAGGTSGMLVLELPGEPNYTFINLYLSGYNYSSGAHWESVISGYAYKDVPSGWLNNIDSMGVQSSGTVPFNTVRLGQKTAASGSGSRLILLGVTGDQSTLWLASDISIDRLKLSYADADHVAWERGITASFLHYQDTTSLGLSGGLLDVPWDGLNGYSGGNYGLGTTSPTVKLDVVGGIRASSGVTFATTMDVGGAARFGGGLSASALYASAGSTFAAAVSVVGGLSASALYASAGSTFGSTVYVGGGVTFASVSDHVGAARFGGGLSASALYASAGSTFGSTVYVGGGVTFATTMDVGGAARFAGGLSASALYASTGSTFAAAVSVVGGLSASALYASAGSTFAAAVSFVGGLSASRLYASAGSTFASNLSVLGAATVNTMVLGSASTGGIVMNVKGKTKYTPGNTFGTPDASLVNQFREYRDLLHIQLGDGNTYGMLVLELPGEPNYTFVELYLSGYNYFEGAHWETVISGYSQKDFSNGWLNTPASMNVISSGTVPFNTVRLGAKNVAGAVGNRLILLGVTGDQSTLWSWASVSIDRLKLSYAWADHVAWERGITASFLGYQDSTSLGLTGGLHVVPWEGLNGYSGGNYGLGTTSPTLKLDVVGGIRASSGVTFATTMDVGGAARFAGGLSASRLYASAGSTFGSTVYVGGGATFATTLNVVGLSTLAGVTARSLFVSQGLTADNIFTTELNVNGPTVTSNAYMNHYSDLVAGPIQPGSTTAGRTGACQIILPYGLTGTTFPITPNGGDLMLRIKIMGHQYRNDPSTYGASWEVIVNAYFSAYGNGVQGAWQDGSEPSLSVVEIRGNAPFSRVRLANKTQASGTYPSKAAILLGDDTTGWHYADVATHVQVTDVWTYYNNNTNWGDGWVIESSLVTQAYIDANYVASFTRTPKIYQYMDMNGNLGLGTTGPQFKLDVAGGIRASSGVTFATTMDVGGAARFAGAVTLLSASALGTPSTLVGTNITGTALGFTAGSVIRNANLTGAITSVGNATSLGTFTVAELNTALSNADITGTTNLVFSDSPVLVNPALGTPSALVGTNITGTALGFTAGSAGIAATVSGAAQTAITSLGTLTGLTVSGGLSASRLYASTGSTFGSTLAVVGGLSASALYASTGSTFASNLSVLGAATVNTMVLGSASTGGIVMNVKGKTKYTPGNTFNASGNIYGNDFREYRDLLHIELAHGTTYGMIVLELPGEPNHTYVDLYLSGYNHTSGSHWETVISGYATPESTGWADNQYECVTSKGKVPFNTIRMGQKAAAASGSRLILLGVTSDESTQWGYGAISIDRLKLSLIGASHVAWERGITASFLAYGQTTSLGLSGGLTTLLWEGLNGYSGGNYGLGTTGPQFKLDVVGGIRASSGVTFATTMDVGGAARFAGAVTLLSASALGTPSTLVGTNMTGTAAGFTVGSAGIAQTVSAAAQPTITSLGTLTSVTVSGSTTVGYAAGATLGVSGSVFLQAQTPLRFGDTDSSHWVGFRAPTTVSTSVLWTLPAIDGTNGQVLSTNAGGDLAWKAADGVTGSDKQIQFNRGGTLGATSGLVLEYATAGYSAGTLGVSGGAYIMGNVGIGITTPAIGRRILPATETTAKLEVRGDISIPSGGFFMTKNVTLPAGSATITIAADENAFICGTVTIPTGTTLTITSGGSFTVL